MLALGLLSGMLIVWGVLTVLTIVVLFYRAVAGPHMENQLHVDKAEEYLEREEREAVRLERRIRPVLYVLGASSVILLVSIVSLWIWHSLGT